MKQAITLLALGVAGIALAQDAPPPFEDVDTNQDGQISRTEAAAIEGIDFDTADTNQDGVLDRTEYMAAASGHGEGAFGDDQDGVNPDPGGVGQDPGFGPDPE